MSHRRQRESGESTDLAIWRPGFYSVMQSDLALQLTVKLAEARFPQEWKKEIVLNELSGCFQGYTGVTKGK